MTKSLFIKLSSILACSAIIAVFSSYIVPFNMDEFIHYHGIICNEYPLNKLNEFTESCSTYDLAIVPNYFLPLRCYEYSGNLLSVLYYPLFKVWPSPSSARFFGLTMLVVQAFLVYRTFQIDILIAFSVLLLFMPYAFQHIVDTGPVAIHATSIFLICYLARQWATSINLEHKYSWRYPLLIGIIIFLAIWVKLFYIILLPAIFILLLIFFKTKKDCWSPAKFRTLLRDAAILIATAALPTFALLNATDRAGNKYYQVLTENNQTGHATMGGGTEHFFDLITYFSNPLKTTHRIFEIVKNDTLDGSLLIALLLLFFIFGIWQVHKRKGGYKFAVVNVGLFAGTFLLMASSQKTWAMHHVILAVPFLLLALFYMLSVIPKSKIVTIFMLVFLALNLHLYYSINKAPISPHSHPSLVKINEYLNGHYSHNYIFVVVDWGMYYLKGLYGNKNQSVLFPEYFSQSNVVELKQVQAKTRRKLMFIGRDDSLATKAVIEKNFYTIECKFPFDTGLWKVWRQP